MYGMLSVVAWRVFQLFFHRRGEYYRRLEALIVFENRQAILLGMVWDLALKIISLSYVSNCRFGQKDVLPILESIEQDLAPGRDLLVVRYVSVKVVLASFSEIVQILAALLCLADEIERLGRLCSTSHESVNRIEFVKASSNAFNNLSANSNDL